MEFEAVSREERWAMLAPLLGSTMQTSLCLIQASVLRVALGGVGWFSYPAMTQMLQTLRSGRNGWRRGGKLSLQAYDFLGHLSFPGQQQRHNISSMLGSGFSAAQLGFTESFHTSETLWSPPSKSQTLSCWLAVLLVAGESWPMSVPPEAWSLALGQRAPQ